MRRGDVTSRGSSEQCSVGSSLLSFVRGRSLCFHGLANINKGAPLSMSTTSKQWDPLASLCCGTMCQSGDC